ncbi:hypothetical protein ACJGE4_20585 (plasmid) [Bacillus velezensis]|uniref:Uncharacterized protein n=1 Tax=Bacillus velezensis TaxID=492670 RepID=A0ABC8DFV9_BACVE|nr:MULTISPECIES: hypothetical protein [Bacillus amyloliquefaciens group]AVI31036.1 hypothetical protein C3Z10_21815 [Bacillus velezensis]AWX74670.1 hypothetical protein BVDSYZ_21745 [Bacillus velezensis]KDN89948.1 hypothetical protein EF87_21040 [Bacillus amyloliquefaciens]MDK2561838.1 hypothetical protein [Bacillus amyloliquefaciens]MED2913948.1 hypothetical protein [Bacillus velezensis]
MAEQKQKSRLKKDLIMPAAAGIRFAEMRPELFGSLSASFERFLEDALAASKQARCLRFNQGKL